MGLVLAKEKEEEKRFASMKTKLDPVSTEEIYDYYFGELLPTIMATLPVFWARLVGDSSRLVSVAGSRVRHFLLPSSSWLSFLAQWNETVMMDRPSLLTKPVPIDDVVNRTPSSPLAFVEFLLKHCDVNEDGHIQPNELLILQQKLVLVLDGWWQQRHQDWLWWQSWPMIDWKIGLFLWRTCGGLLVILALVTMIPGKMQGYSGRILRWPILGITYAIITTELVAYVALRFFIRFLEAMVSNSKHRSLRYQMTQVQSYQEWYDIADALDESQGRRLWKGTVTDYDTRHNYNWAFIQELMSDMRRARKNNDSIAALAVLRQCTRKNVGGIMNDVLFSYTNTGEPKDIVKTFIAEVETTLRWVTVGAKKISCQVESEKSHKNGSVTKGNDRQYKESLYCKTEEEKKKVLRGMMSWATLSILGQDSDDSVQKKTGGNFLGESPDRSLNNYVSKSINTTRKSVSKSNSQQEIDEDERNLPPVHRETVKLFLKRARAAYGRTALCLSGGAMMGCYHFGVIKALLKEDALPKIISGTSAGSVIAAMACCRTNEELERDLTAEKVAPMMRVFAKPWRSRIRHFYHHKCLFNYHDWEDLLNWFTCGDMTFEEAYHKTGRILCVTICSTTKRSPPILINYITAPEVLISSALFASAAVPGLIKPVRLKIKDANGRVRYQAENKDEAYWDGSIEQDIPISGLSEMFNCQFFIASQCNPHIVPFFYHNKGDVGRPSRWSRRQQREESWRGGFLLSALELYLKSDMQAKLQFLNDIEAAVGFTSKLMTQQFYGTTTIIPQVGIRDYFCLFADASYASMQQYFQGGSVSTYHHMVMVKLHFRIACALDECLSMLEEKKGTQR